MLSGATYSGIKSYASSKKQSDIEDALDYLSGKGWFRVGMGDRDDFINNYGDKLGYMTGVIYDMFKAYKDAGTSDDKIKETLLGSGGTGASSILAKNLSNYLLASE
jgi:hypothetical protein